MRALCQYFLGDMEAKSVFHWLEALRPQGAFVEDPEAMRKFGLFSEKRKTLDSMSLRCMIRILRSRGARFGESSLRS